MSFVMYYRCCIIKYDVHVYNNDDSGDVSKKDRALEHAVHVPLDLPLRGHERLTERHWSIWGVWVYPCAHTLCTRLLEGASNRMDIYVTYSCAGTPRGSWGKLWSGNV